MSQPDGDKPTHAPDTSDDADRPEAAEEATTPWERVGADGVADEVALADEALGEEASLDEEAYSTEDDDDEVVSAFVEGSAAADDAALAEADEAEDETAASDAPALEGGAAEAVGVLDGSNETAIAGDDDDQDEGGLVTLVSEADVGADAASEKSADASLTAAAAPVAPFDSTATAAESFSADEPAPFSTQPSPGQGASVGDLPAAESTSTAVAAEVSAPLTTSQTVPDPLNSADDSYQAHVLDEPDGQDDVDAFRDFAARGPAAPSTTPAATADDVVEEVVVAEVVHGEAPAVAPEPPPPAREPRRFPTGLLDFDPVPAGEATPLAPDELAAATAAANEWEPAAVVVPAGDEPDGVAPAADEAWDEDAAGDAEPVADGGADGGAEEAADEPDTLGYASRAGADADEPELVAAGSGGGGAWTIPMLCGGIGLIACCLLIPLADGNRRLAYERQQLRRDLESIQAQVATNDEFIRRVHDDPALAERLAQRQLKTIREGTGVLRVGAGGAGAGVPGDVSPFQIVAVPPPEPLPPYKPVGGTIADLCYRPRARLYLTGAGLMLMAAGLVLGVAPRQD